jgi:hypothetical protein
MYGHLFFNPFLVEDDISGVGGIDFAKTFRDNSITPPVYYPSRLQTGREASPPDLPGLMPTHTALLACNWHVSDAGPNGFHPGMLITKEIDVSAYTGPAGTDEFMLYWHLLDFTISEDIASDIGATTGLNEPAIRYVKEPDQEPVGFSAWISPDNGTHWCEVSRFEPVSFASKTTKIRIAFRNDGDTKIFIANWAVLF